jgi:UDP-N-acetyl-D-glucosamine dehydrogenase
MTAVSAELTGLLAGIANRTSVVGVIGLGHVGLPLALATAAAGYRALGFDVNSKIVAALNAGESHILEIPGSAISRHIATGEFQATTDFGRLGECDVTIVCVPTPLNKLRDPDLSFVIAAMRAVSASLRPGRLVVLESTTYPGTTRDIVQPLLAQSGLRIGVDYTLCFSPERVDPANQVWTIANTPKLLGGITPVCTEIGAAFYRSIVETVIEVDSAEVAELAKVYENTFRMVNIALANELAQVCARLRLDVWRVIDAAATKPFGFMKFVPGPGLGGHCIPLDPHYLSWKMETLDFKTRLIELASEINARMPAYVVDLVGDALNDRARSIKTSNVLIVGVAYKRDVADYRESPALDVIRILSEKGALVSFSDSHCSELPAGTASPMDENPLRGVPLTREILAAADVVLILTDHQAVDYDLIADASALVVDTRGVMRAHPGRAQVVGLSGGEGVSR